MDIGLVKVIDLCSRLADIVLLLLSVHIDYGVAKEPICALLTAQYEALNAVVKLVGFNFVEMLTVQIYYFKMLWYTGKK